MQSGDERSIRGYVSGRVQGVGFRYFVQRSALDAGVGGYVRNLPDGRVEFRLQGPPGAVGRVLADIRRGPGYAKVSDVQVEECTALDGSTDFIIRR